MTYFSTFHTYYHDHGYNTLGRCSCACKITPQSVERIGVIKCLSPILLEKINFVLCTQPDPLSSNVTLFGTFRSSFFSNY